MWCLLLAARCSVRPNPQPSCSHRLSHPPSTPQINATKKAVRFRPPEVAAGLQRLELAKEHLAVSWRCC